MHSLCIILRVCSVIRGSNQQETRSQSINLNNLQTNKKQINDSPFQKTVTFKRRLVIQIAVQIAKKNLSNLLGVDGVKPSFMAAKWTQREEWEYHMNLHVCIVFFSNKMFVVDTQCNAAKYSILLFFSFQIFGELLY